MTTTSDAPAETAEYVWTGIDQHGAYHTGRNAIPDLPAWTERRYRSGWRLLFVHHAESEHLAAAIEASYVNPLRRSWWAEQSGLLAAEAQS